MLGATLEDNLALSYQAKHSLPIQPSNHTPQYLPKSLENLCPQKPACVLLTITKKLKQPACSSTSDMFILWNITQ